MCRAVKMFAATLLLFSLVGVSRQLLITVHEVPLAVEYGSSAELECFYSLEGDSEVDVIVKWWWTPVSGPENLKLVYQRIGVAPGAFAKPENKEIRGNDTIVLLAPTPLDSGTYECEVSIGPPSNEEERKRDRLIVFTPGSGPNLTLTKVPDGHDQDEDEDLLIECHADDVAPAPYLLVKINGIEYKWASQAKGPDAKGMYDVSWQTTVSQSAVEGASVSCELLYHDEELTHPQYIHQIDYVSDEPASTAAPAAAPGPDAAPDSLQHPPSGDSSRCRASWAALLAVTLAVQLRTILSLPM